MFWVFGTDVMVSVAKGLNAPIKILFPKALGVTPVPVSMLGLGDIVIPGARPGAAPPAPCSPSPSPLPLSHFSHSLFHTLSR